MTDSSQDATPVGEGAATGVGWRFTLGFAAVIALILTVTGVALNRIGVAARAVPTGAARIVVVDDSNGLLDAWANAGVHGAVLVNVTRDLGYAVPLKAFPHASGLPVPLRDLQRVFRSAAERPSVIWVASHLGIARSVTYVLGPEDMAQKVRLGRENGWPGIAPDGRSITSGDEEGYVRRIGDRFPSLPAGADVLNIDASYFVKGTPEALARQLDESALSYRFVTLNRSIDATDVPQSARDRLDRMAEILRESETP